ncbi:L,D-transpeptidase family protein [Streptomyces sp. NPDC127068]|uniref:L,D-transpeptidase family protein n=1 Tax=Streptomyces sp. NPDC127068 TaxID=3347127 RepID=UPI003669C6A3
MQIASKPTRAAVSAALGAVLILTGAQNVGAAPASAASAPAERQAAAAAPSYYLKFVKRKDTDSDRTTTPYNNSRLHLMQSVAGAADRTIAHYRAGSGVNGRVCSVGKGWLPNGKYKIEFHRKNFDGIINGYVIKISDKRCSSAAGAPTRTALFIHSEMKPNGGQGSIESERWDGYRDYNSEGCIKVQHTNIKKLFGKIDTLGWSRLKGLVVTGP